MAATHTYDVTTASYVGDVCTIVGTVDTIPSTGPIAVTVVLNYSAVTQAWAISVANVEALVGRAMLNAAVANGLPNPNPPATATQLPTGSFTL
jgi:hypothetical protein